MVRTYTHFLINFRWLSSGKALGDVSAKWKGSAKPVADDADNNRDCLSQSSGDLLWVNVNCEADSAETQIANICFAKAQA